MKDCMTCKYWVKEKEQVEGVPDLGKCKRYPPQVFSDSPFSQYELFPLTGEADWCGEWKNK